MPLRPRALLTGALTSSLALLACSGGEVQSTASLELGQSSQALGSDRGPHSGSGKAHAKGEGHRRHHGPHHRHRGHHAHRRDCPDESATPEPESFTPASAAALTGRLAGVAVAYGPLTSEPEYAQAILDHFSDVTPENATKWGPLQPESPRLWDFTQADAIAAFARDGDLRLKGHTLVWHSQMPSFIDAETSARRLDFYSKRHVSRTVRHFKRDAFAWDVVNEAIADDGSGLRESVFSQAFGEGFIDRAFHRAARADRRAELYYNDYGIAGLGPKSDAVYALATRLLDRRVPIDGVGMQGHFDARFAPSYDELVENFQRFADLGLSVNVSELDVRIAQLGGSRAYRLAVQKQIYQRVAAACVAVEGCSGITTWGFTDAHSWIDSTFGADDPLLFDDAYQKKPAYFGYVDGFVGVPLDDASLEPNLIANSSMEAGLDGFSVMGSGTLSIVLDDAHTGRRSLRHSERGDTWQGPRNDVTALVTATRSYDASTWVRLDGAASAGVALTAQITCGGEASTFSRVADADASDGDWVELSGTLELPDCDLSQVALYVEGPAAQVDLLVDDLALREQPLPNLIGNPGFESGTGGWFGWGPTQLAVTADANSGAAAVIGTGRTDSWNGIATDVTAQIEPGASYRADAFMKIAGSASDSVVLTAAVQCVGGSTQFVRVGSATGNDVDWTQVGGTVTAPACPLESFVLYAEGPAGGVDLLLDDVSLWQVAPPAPLNAIANPDFESGTGGWFGFGSATVEATTDRAHGGSQSGRVSGRTASWNGLATSLVGQLTPGASYSARAFAQIGSGTSNVNLTFQNACDGGAESYAWVAGGSANDADWLELSGTLVVPDCNLTTANLYIEGAPAGVDIYLDDVELIPVP